MRRYTLLFLWLCCLLPAPIFGATTYYVRTDGGTSDQCTGTTNAAYPGTGTNQPCAWAHPFWALDSNGDWKIQGGDTIIIAPGSYKMGYAAPNTGWCDADGAFDCHLPPLPSGPDSARPTRILGKGWDSGCSNPPELWGTQRSYHIIDLTGTSNAVIACLELTDHSGCVEFHSNPSVACERDTYPYGDWASAGIYASDSSKVILRNLNIHGFAETGVRAGRIADWTVEDVRIAANGWAGWDGDLPDGTDSNSGTLRFKRWTVEWNGCAETYPGEKPDHCWAQTAGGYGDGVGTGATGGHWIIEDSIFRYNTSDGLDLLYLGSDSQNTMVEIKRTVAVGNAGNPIKVAGPATIENSLLVANCGYFAQKSFAQEMGDHCRAGGNALALSLHKGSTVSVVNSTIVGEGDVLVEAECDPSSQCDGTESVTLQNNIFVGYGDFLSPGDETGFLWDPSNFTNGRIDYNMINNVKFDSQTCPFGANDICADPVFVDDTLASFNGHLQPGSQAIDSATSQNAPSEDLEKFYRPTGSGHDMGCYEFGPGLNVTGTSATITAIPQINTPVTLTISPAESNTSYYRFFAGANYGAPWSEIQPWSTNNSCTYTPTGEANTVLVAHISDTTDGGRYHQAGFSFATSGHSESGVVITSITTNLGFPQTAGTPITVTVQAVGSGTIYYKYWYKDANGWNIIKDWSEDSTATWTPPKAGTFTVAVWANTVADDSVPRRPIAGITCTIGG